MINSTISDLGKEKANFLLLRREKSTWSFIVDLESLCSNSVLLLGDPFLSDISDHPHYEK